MSSWKVIDTGVNSAEKNMEIDATLLSDLNEKDCPGILHFYEWEKPSLSYGYFIDPAQQICLDEVKRRGIQIARRPTGGGVLFHIWDYAFSVLIPTPSSCYYANVLDSYAFVNQTIVEAVRPLLEEKERLGGFCASEVEILDQADLPLAAPSCARFCMAHPTRYDVLVEGKKFIGAAQRRVKQGILHQGTISLMMPDPEVLYAVLDAKKDVGRGVAQAMLSTTFALLGTEASEIEKLKNRIKELICQSFCQSFLSVIQKNN